MDVGRAFSYPFRDPAWIKKVLIGAVLLIIPIFGILTLVGYGMQIMRNVVSGSDETLPEWADIGTYFVDGVKAFIVGLFWSIPALLIHLINLGPDSLALNCLGSLINVICSVLAAIAVVAVAVSRDFNAGFQVGTVINRLTRNFGDWVIVFLLTFVLGIVALAGVVACVVGVFATIAYAYVVQAHLWAQAFRRTEGMGDLAPAPRF